MNRGDIYSAATGGGFGSKPRPVLIVQAEIFMTAKRLVALIGSPVDDTDIIRVPVEPDPVNSLNGPSVIMVDAILPVRDKDFGYRIGQLSNDDMRRVDIALMMFLGLAG